MRLIANPVSIALHFVLLSCLAIGSVGLCFADEKDAIQFEGNVTFTSQQLSDELGCNPEYVVAACTNQDADTVAALVERLLTLGYKSCGFPKTSISAQVQSSEHAESRILVRIQEGKHFKLGQVHVNGVDNKVAELIRDQLTKPRPKGEVFPTFVLVDGKEQMTWKNVKGEAAKTEDPHWNIGKTANFHWNIPKISDNVAHELEELGFVETKFESTVDVKEESGVADLVINVEQLGGLRSADNILVQGLYGTEVSDLLALVELKEGDQCDTNRIRMILRKLWESGRFSKHTVRWHPEDKNRLVIEVEKATGVPWLDQPLDEKAQVVLRSRAWLSGLTLSDEELSVEYQDDKQSKHVIISKEGVYARAGKKGESDRYSSSFLEVIGDATGITVDCDQLPKHLGIPLGNAGGRLNLSMRLGCLRPKAYSIPGTKSDHQTFDWFLGFEASSGKSPEESIIGWAMTLNPADWLPFAYRSDFEFKTDEKYLTITSSLQPDSNRNIVIEKQTGKIVKCDWDEASLVVGTGLFDAARQSILEKPNAFDSVKPITSVMAFACQRECWDLYRALKDVEVNDHLRTAINKVVEENSLAPLDELVSSALFTTNHEVFSIPPGDNAQRDGGLSYAFSYLPLKLGTFFPSDSWPRKVATVQALLALDQRRNASTVIDALLEDPANGPVCHALLAFCLRHNAQARTSEVAAHGLKMMDAVSIANDLQVLNSYVPEKWIVPPMNAVRSFSPEEIDAINDSIPYPQVGKFLTQLRQSETVSLASLWEAVGYSQGNFLETKLKELENFKLPPPKQEDRFASEPKKQPEKKASNEDNIGDKYLLLR